MYIYIYIYANVAVGDLKVVKEAQCKKRLATVTPNACMHSLFTSSLY